MRSNELGDPGGELLVVLVRARRRGMAHDGKNNFDSGLVVLTEPIADRASVGLHSLQNRGLRAAIRDQGALRGGERIYRLMHRRDPELLEQRDDKFDAPEPRQIRKKLVVMQEVAGHAQQTFTLGGGMRRALRRTNSAKCNQYQRRK